jgi:hypothetical protein
MAYINAASSADFVRVLVRVTAYSSGVPVAPTAASFHTTGTATAGTLEVPALQDITITNTPSTFRWKQLDTASEKVVTSVSSNSIAGTLVLDPATFFGEADASGVDTAKDKGIFNLSNEKTQVNFLIGLSGLSTGDRYIMGTGYFSGVAPTVSADSPVWTSPVSIEVDGDFVAGTI